MISLLDLLDLGVLAMCASGIACAPQAASTPRPVGHSSPFLSVTSAGSSAPESSTLPIAAMTVTRREGAAHRLEGELHEDGAMYVSTVLVARIRGSQLLDARGRMLFEVRPDGSVRRGDHDLAMELTRDGDLAMQQEILRIRSDGWVTGQRSDGTTHLYNLQFDRVPPEARRTAALLLFFVIGVTAVRDSQPPAPLAIPSRTAGTLEPTDPAAGVGSVGDRYLLTLQAHHPITIVVRGGESTSNPGTRLDMFADVIRVRGGLVAQDDDSAGDLNSRLIVTPTEDGHYLLSIRALGEGVRTGAYEVEIWNGVRADAR